MISAAEESGAEFAVRVNLMNPSATACANLPTGTSCLSAVTYQLWSQHGKATRRVMISEQRRSDPDSLIAYLLHRITGSSEIYGRRVSETERNMMNNAVASRSTDWLPTQLDLVHYIQCFVSSGAGVEPPGVVYQPRSSISLGNIRSCSKGVESPERFMLPPFPPCTPEGNVATMNPAQVTSAASQPTTRSAHSGYDHVSRIIHVLTTESYLNSLSIIIENKRIE